MSNYRLHFVLVLTMDVTSALTSRHAFNSGSLLFLFLSMLSLALAGYFFIRLMQDRVGIIVNATWVALGTTLVTIASYLVYGEKINWLQVGGMAVVVSGIIIIEYYSPKEIDSSLISK